MSLNFTSYCLTDAPACICLPKHWLVLAILHAWLEVMTKPITSKLDSFGTPCPTPMLLVIWYAYHYDIMASIWGQPFPPSPPPPLTSPHLSSPPPSPSPLLPPPLPSPLHICTHRQLRVEILPHLSKPSKRWRNLQTGLLHCWIPVIS